MRRAVKRSSKRFRTAGRERAGKRSTARTAPSTSSTMKPVRPSSITSRTEPWSKAITGTPQAMASIITSPKGSGQPIGNSRACAPDRNSAFWCSPISPMNSTCGCDSSGRICSSK